MRKRASFALAAALGLVALGAAPRAAQACLTCTASQWCADGSEGSSCMTYIADGQRWCQFTLDCGAKRSMTPLEVSPAGTYLAQGGERVIEDGVEKQDCNGFIVGHLAGDEPGDETAQTIRI